MLLPDVQPGDSAVVVRLTDLRWDDDKDARLNLTVGEVTHQFALNDWLLAVARQKLAVPKNTSTVALNIVPQFFRAPTDNDKSFGNWLAKDWAKHRLDAAEACPVDDETTEYRFANGSIVVTTRQTLLEDGAVLLTQTYECKGELPELPRLGLRIELPVDYEDLSWYGRGPWDNYPDRKSSCPIGRYASTVTAQYTHFPRPQDCGNHEDCAEVVLRAGKRHGIRVTAVDAPFSFSALHYSPADLVAVTHDFELPVSTATYLSIDCAVLGLGNSSCGPGVLKRYSIDKNKKHELKICIRRW